MPTLTSRPQTLFELAERIREDARLTQRPILGLLAKHGSDFRHHLLQVGFDAAMVQAQPPTTGDVVADAYLAGLSEYLARRAGMQPPAWTELPQYFLREPAQFGGPNFQRLALIETPSAWRRRLVFCGQSAYQDAGV